MKAFQQILLFLFFSIPAIGQNLNPMDAMVVIDNSASMRKNDPDFLLKQALNIFIEKLHGDTYTGFILFSDKVDMFLPLNPLQNDSTKTGLKKIINQINYSGKYTNIPSAIEKAYYELKVNGRSGSDKIIIFLTDGIVDLYDKTKNEEKSHWLKEVITEDCKKERIRIISIAFTEQADFELIQTLSSKTGGNYYRALNAAEIIKVFNIITSELNQNVNHKNNIVKKSETETIVNTEKTKPYSESSLKFFIISVTLLIIVIIAIIFLVFHLKKKNKSENFNEFLPEAFIVDISGITNKGTYQIRKRITRIGRADTNDIHIPDEKNFISSFHAIIEYRDNNFYIIDHDSVNGTFVNGNKIEKNEKVLLKGGDEIAFDKFAFKFLCPEEGERGQTVLNMGGTFGTETIQNLPEDPTNANDSNTIE